MLTPAEVGIRDWEDGEFKKVDIPSLRGDLAIIRRINGI
jgi:hypothetical protein